MSLIDKDNNGNPVLLGAIKEVEISIFDSIVEGRTSKPTVCMQDMIEYLLSYDPNQLSLRDNEGKTPLLCAA